MNLESIFSSVRLINRIFYYLTNFYHPLTDKIRATASIVKPKHDLKQQKYHPVTPKGSSSTLEEEVESLKAQNAELTEKLEAIQAQADQQVKKHYDLVWYARNRGVYYPA